jgi:phosphatidate cytidylyltransferase
VLAKRIITAIIAIPLLVALIYWGSKSLFLILIMLVVVFGMIEFYNMSLKDNRLIKAVAIAVGLVGVWFIYYYQGYLSFENTNGLNRFIAWSIALMTFAVFIFLLMHLIFFPKEVLSLTKPLIVVIGIFYVGLFLSYLILIRCSEDGRSWMFFTLSVIWFGDCGAYTIGRLIGKHQLSPAASPKKKIECALGGFAASLITAFGAKLWFFRQLTMTHCAVLAIGIAIVGQLGDLCESTFKRRNSVKDSGKLLPGHGGMLDRIDSIIFAAPFVYYYILIL